MRTGVQCAENGKCFCAVGDAIWEMWYVFNIMDDAYRE